MIMIIPCCIILIQIRINPIFVGSNGLLAVIAYNNGRNTTKIVQRMVVDLDPLGFAVETIPSVSIPGGFGSSAYFGIYTLERYISFASNN